MLLFDFYDILERLALLLNIIVAIMEIFGIPVVTKWRIFQGHKGAKYLTILIFILSSIFGFILITYDRYEKGDELFVKTISEPLKMRSEPGIDDSKIIAKLSRNTRVIYLKKKLFRTRFKECGSCEMQHDYWRKVKYRNKFGWVYGGYLR